MRIIAGKFGGRKLVSFRADHIRPTTDRIKGSLFNQLEARSILENARVLDLYAGTGSLGLEALSRGAQSVTAVELNKASIDIIEKNCQLLGVKAGYSIQRGDVLKWLERYRGVPFSLILADPPFTEKLAHSTLHALSQSESVGPGTVIVLESGAKEHVADQYDRLELVSKRSYGDKTAWIWSC